MWFGLEIDVVGLPPLVRYKVKILNKKIYSIRLKKIYIHTHTPADRKSQIQKSG